MDDSQVDLVADIQLQQRILKSLDRTGHVTLMIRFQRAGLTFSRPQDVLERAPAATCGHPALRSRACRMLAI